MPGQRKHSGLRRGLPVLLAALLTAPPVYAASLASKIGDLIPSLDRLDVDLKGAVGVAAVSTPDYSGSNDAETRLLPVLILSYKDKYYFNIKRAGVWLYANADRSFKAGVAIEPRGGYNANDNPVLAGMQGRDISLEGGVSVYWKPARYLVWEASYETDLSSTADGSSANLKLSIPFYRSEKLSLAGSLAMEWLSNNVVRYYYGVLPSEVTASRTLYSPNDTVNYALAMLGEYRFDRHWRVFTGASVRRLGGEITDSPIVLDRYQRIGYVGVGWGF